MFRRDAVEAGYSINVGPPAVAQGSVSE